MIGETFFLFSLFFILLVSVSSISGEIKWFDEGYQKALKVAKRSKKFLMLDFCTDCCSACQRMEKELYKDEKFLMEISKLQLIPLKIDPEKDEESEKISLSFKIKSYPTVIFLDSMGREIGRIVGFSETEDFLEKMKNILEEKTTLDFLKKRYEENKDDLLNAYKYAKRLYSMEEEDKAIKIFEEIYDKDKENKQNVGGQSLVILLIEKVLKIIENMKYFYMFRAQPMVEDIKICEDKELKFKELFHSMRDLLNNWIISNSAILEKYFEESYLKLKSFGNIKYEVLSDKFIHLNALAMKEWGKVPLLLADIFEIFEEPTLMNEVAWINYRYQRKLEDSLELARRSYEIGKDSFSLVTQAHILMSLGRKEEAIRIVKFALEEAKKEELNEMIIKSIENILKNFEENKIGYVMDFVELANKDLKRVEDLEKE